MSRISIQTKQFFLVPFCLSFLISLFLHNSVKTANASSELNACFPGDQNSFTELELSKDSQLLIRLRQDAANGYSNGLCCLAELYLRGWGVETDDEKAWDLFNQAAIKGNSKAMHRIAGMYELGVHVQQNYQKALQWHLRAANLGYASAQSDVGIFYEDGLTGARDIAVALFWYRKAAAQDEPFAVEALQRLKQEQR